MKLSIAVFCKNLRYYSLLYFANAYVSRIPFYNLRLWFYRKFMNFRIGRDSYILTGATFNNKGDFELGKNSTINQNCHLDNRGGITIGDKVSISNEVCIITADHDHKEANFPGRERPVIIEDYVFVGTRAMILGGVRIGRGAIIAAGAVVNRDVPPYSIVAGVPGRVVGKRREDLKYSSSFSPLFM